MIGRGVSVEGGSFELVGIAPPGFNYPDGTDAWISWPLNPNGNRRSRGANVFGRLPPNVDIETARADLSTIARRLEDAYPEADRGIGVYVLSLRDATVGDLTAVLWILFAASSVLLLAMRATAIQPGVALKPQ